MMEHGWGDAPVESERLYDVVFDPSEANNLAENPAYADVLAEMQNRLEQWRTERTILSAKTRLWSHLRLLSQTIRRIYHRVTSTIPLVR